MLLNIINFVFNNQTHFAKQIFKLI